MVVDVYFLNEEEDNFLENFRVKRNVMVVDVYFLNEENALIYRKVWLRVTMSHIIK